MTPATDNTRPKDLGSIAEHAAGRLAYLCDGKERYLRRLADERRITTYKIGGKLLISASEVEALITARPALVG